MTWFKSQIIISRLPTRPTLTGMGEGMIRLYFLCCGHRSENAAGLLFPATVQSKRLVSEKGEARQWYSEGDNIFSEVS